MTFDEIQSKDSFIVKCRQAYNKNIRPSDPMSKNRPDYTGLVKIAQLYFANGYQARFAEYFIEGQYLINLWAAHLIIEYGCPDNALKENCLLIIKQYSETPLDQTLAKEEPAWLESFEKIKKLRAAALIQNFQ